METPVFRKPYRISAAFVASTRRPGKYVDRHGLLYRVYPSGARCWEQRITVNGRRRTYGLGSYPVVSLSEARERAFENLRLVRSGGDPGAERRKRREPTVAEAAVVVCEQRKVQWTSPREASNWMSSLEHHVLPRLGKLRVSAIEPRDVLSVLIPLYRDRMETGQRVRQRLSLVMQWAMANGYRTDNPAGEAISGGLPRAKRKLKRHHRAMPHGEVGRVVGMIRRWPVNRVTALAFEFLVLTGARACEVRCAVWSEVDVARRLWTVPAERMKGRVEHMVPLSTRALAVLEEARELAGGPGTEAVFPNREGRFFGESRFRLLLRALRVEAVPHGFRASLRSWCADTGVDRELAEACLAHTVGNQTELAYKRTLIMERRRPIMEAWAQYVGEGTGSAAAEGSGAAAVRPGPFG